MAMLIMNKFHFTCSWFFMLFMLSVSPPQALSDDRSYMKSLLKFRQSLTNADKLNDWKEPVDHILCFDDKKSSWTGVVCKNKTFNGLRLENMSLGGKIDVDALSELPLLSFSVKNNNFTGAFPGGINKLGRLRRLYLNGNNFSGEISGDAFLGMNSLKEVYLGDNLFSGEIPVSLIRVPLLHVLELQNNQFSGRIPGFLQFNLTVNFSGNRLQGAIPDSLQNNGATSFQGNVGLCGAPLAPCRKHSIKKIMFIVAAVVGVALAAFVILFMVCRRRSKPLRYEKSVDHFQTKEEKKNNGGTDYKRSEHGKIHFVRNERERFELEDLLRASAEVLGSGSFGSSYKAVLLAGHPYVVRRFRQMNQVGKAEFHEHMRRLGRLSHSNLLPLVGFYYRREEKLLVTDFVENGSLASHLHGKRSGEQQGLDWATRLKIIKGVARGLSHLYKHLPTLTLPHGHFKSSNVLLDAKFEAILGDYALAPVMNKDHSQQFMAAYKSPESMQKDTVSRKTDVWSLGILILEVLTGRFPANYLKKGRGPSSDLATWVSSVVREEWSGEVFDKEMGGARRGEGQMLRLLRIGMCCCEWDVERRWDMDEAVERIEELKERESDEEYSTTSYASEGGDVYSNSAITDDNFSFSKAS